MEKDLIMGIDSGTQSVRAIVYDMQGNELALAQASHEPYFSSHPGWAEQNPDDYWQKLCKVTNKVMASGKFAPKRLAAVGVTSQRNNVIAVDKKGNPLRNAIIWLDQRSTENPPPISKKIKLLFSLIGKGDIIQLVQRNSYFNWIKTNEPAIYRQTHKFCVTTGWFVKKLTDRFNDSAAMFNGYWPLNAKRFGWHGMPGVMDVFGVRRDQLPKLYKPNEVLGAVTKQAADETGLPAELPVVVGAGDKQSESLGTGSLTSNVGAISFGTASTLGVLTRAYLEDRKLRFFTWCSALPDAWILECFIFRGFWMARWFLDVMGQMELVEAEKRGIAPEAVLDEVIKKIPPGSQGLMLHPHWTPHTSSKFSKGSIIGFASYHTRAHIYRAILEGIAFELKRMGEIVQKKTKMPLTELRVGGGGSRSDVAVQIAADIFGLPAKRMKTYETCALGAAMDAAVAVGLFPGFVAATSSMVQVGREFLPDKNASEIYDRLFREVYLKTYGALAPLYRKSARIAGYSETKD